MIDIEKAVLAILLKRGGDDCISTLKSEYFQNPQNRRMFDAIYYLFTENKPIDAVTVGQEIKNATYTVSVSEYADLMVCTKQELDELIKKLKEAYAKRTIVQAIKKTYDILTKGGDVTEARAGLINTLENINITDDTAKPKTMKQALLKTMEWIEKQYILQEEEKLLTTHLPDLNDMIGGLMPQDLILIGARPSVGKTSLAMDIAKHVAMKGHRVQFVTLEMSAESLCIRYMAGAAEMDTQKVRTGKLSDEDWTKLGKVIKPLGELQIIFDDVSKNVTEIKVAAKEIKAQGELDLIIIDYIQLLHPEGRHDTREQEVASISRSLKELAKELDVPVIALAQLSREAEGKRPVLGHLRESGAQEQDADLVMFLWEPPEDELKSKWQAVRSALNNKGNRLIELIVAKQRNGMTGATYLCYIPGRTMFMCMPKGGDTGEEGHK
ncbi:MAG TPA: AAA family ATPase [Thermoanaerobacterales bacterium]|nr:AAA family ATPase [Thermoanaerobacterales bacterium]